MNNTFAIITAGAFTLASVSAFADDRTPYDFPFPSAEQAKMKQEAVAKQVAMAKMTPEAKKARNTETVKMEDTLEKVLQNPQGRNNAINKSAAVSLAGPSPARGFINTSKGEEFLREEKGQ